MLERIIDIFTYILTQAQNGIVDWTHDTKNSHFNVDVERINSWQLERIMAINAIKEIRHNSDVEKEQDKDRMKRRRRESRDEKKEL